jgi:hypothetical protein
MGLGDLGRNIKAKAKPHLVGMSSPNKWKKEGA